MVAAYCGALPARSTCLATAGVFSVGGRGSCCMLFEFPPGLTSWRFWSHRRLADCLMKGGACQSAFREGRYVFVWDVPPPAVGLRSGDMCHDVIPECPPWYLMARAVRFNATASVRFASRSLGVQSPPRHGQLLSPGAAHFPDPHISSPGEMPTFITLQDHFFAWKSD